MDNLPLPANWALKEAARRAYPTAIINVIVQAAKRAPNAWVPCIELARMIEKYETEPPSRDILLARRLFIREYERHSGQPWAISKIADIESGKVDSDLKTYIEIIQATKEEYGINA